MRLHTLEKDGVQLFIGDIGTGLSVKETLLKQLDNARAEIERLDFISTNGIDCGIQIKLVYCEVTK